MSKWRMRRLISALAIAGLGALGVAAPADAALAPGVAFSNGCGTVTIHVTDATDEDIVYKRNGVVFSASVAASSSVIEKVGVYAAGDVLSVQIEEGVPFTHTYVVPDSCALPAPVLFELEIACHGLAFLHVNNTGTTVNEAYTLKVGATTPVNLEIEPGETSELLGAAGDDVVLISGTGEAIVLWLRLAPKSPKACGPGTMAATFVDTCDAVKVTVTSTIETPQAYFVVKNAAPPAGELVGFGFVVTGTPQMEEVAAVAGDVISVYTLPDDDDDEGAAADLLKKAKRGDRVSAGALEGLALIGAHSYVKPANCGGTGGGLPVTGFQVGLASGIGLLLVAGGALLFLIARRRRIRFSDGQ